MAVSSLTCSRGRATEKIPMHTPDRPRSAQASPDRPSKAVHFVRFSQQGSAVCQVFAARQYILSGFRSKAVHFAKYSSICVNIHQFAQIFVNLRKYSSICVNPGSWIQAPRSCHWYQAPRSCHWYQAPRSCHWYQAISTNSRSTAKRPLC